MKKLLFLLISLFLISCDKCKSVGENQICDVRDGRNYKIEKIGELIWFKENLRYNNYNGTKANEAVCYNNNFDVCVEYGRLYKWAMAMDDYSDYNEKKLYKIKEQHQGICPQGWHIPNNNEWMNLFENKPNLDFFQFSGYKREETNSFVEFEEIASYWSTEQSLENNACVFSIRKNNYIERNCETNISRKENNHAIRCVKDYSFTLASSSSIEYYSSSSSNEDEPIYYYSSDSKEPEENDIQARDDRLAEKLELAKNSKLGDGKMLEGHIYLLGIFVDTETPHTKWTKKEKDHVLERQQWALDWITNKANKYNILVGFERDVWGYLDKSIPVKEVNNTGFSWLTSGAKNYLEHEQDLNGYISWIRKVKKTENVRVIVYTKVSGRSHAIVTSDPGNRKLGGSYLKDATLIFVGRDNKSYLHEDFGTLFAHEFLHLFGADDLYDNEENKGADGKYRQSGQLSGPLKKSIKDVVSKKGMEDIMYNSYPPFSQLEISDLTACLLGWKKEPENWFRSAIDKCRQ